MNKSKQQTAHKPTLVYSKPTVLRNEEQLLKIDAVKSFNTNYELLKDIMLFQSPTYDTARNKAKAAYLLDLVFDYTGVEGINLDGNLYFTKGLAEFYPTVVAHYDTAQDYHEDLQIIQTKDWIYGFNNYKGKQCGIGADDSVGLYFAIEMLKRLDHCKVVFFYGEERGCIGSNACNMQFFDDSIIVTQLDRRSYSTDFIKYTNGLEVFPTEHYDLITSLMDTYGYSFNDGSCTDVGALRRRGLKVASHNLSCGYLNEHMDDEIIHINSMENAFCFAQEMLEMLSERNIPLSFPVKMQVQDDLIYSGRSSHYDVFDEIYEKTTGKVTRDTILSDVDFRYRVLENMYGNYEVFVPDAELLAYYEGYHGEEKDYEVDLACGELSPELFVCLTKKQYTELTGEIQEADPEELVESRLVNNLSPVTGKPLNKGVEYYIDHGVIYCRDSRTYIPYEMSPEDCLNFPDDDRNALSSMCNEFTF